MKKLIAATVLAASAAIVGCKSVPTTDQMYTASYSIGCSAGLVANMTKIGDTSRNAVIDIVNIVDSCIPETNQTFTAAWTPIAQEHVNTLVKNGKIDEGQGILIMGTFKVAVNGIDYLMNVRYPQARQYQDLTEAAVHGFTTGFLKVFKPANTLSSEPVKIDKEAYDYLMSSGK